MQLIFWHGLTGPDGVTLQAMVEQFVADNPDISVRIESMPWGIYYDKLLAAMVSGDPPDVFVIHEFNTAGYVRQGVLRSKSFVDSLIVRRERPRASAPASMLKIMNDALWLPLVSPTCAGVTGQPRVSDQRAAMAAMIASGRP